MRQAAITAKRIAIVSDSIYPYNTGGKETRILELSTRLAALGHDVHIYTMHWWSDPSKHRVEHGVHLHAVSHLYPLYAGERRSIKQGILFGLACFKLLNARFDVIDVDHMPYFPLFSVRIVAWLKRKPMYATWHEVWGSSYWQQYLGGAGHIAYAIERLSTLLPSKIISVSDLTTARLKQEMKVTQPTILVRNGVAVASIRQVRAKRSSSDIIYAGRLIEHKHVDVLLRAVARLKQTRPDIKCYIIGDGPERANLETLSRSLGLQSNVRFFGFLDNHHDVYAYMKASRVFVLPSTREGFGISVIEANACGLPVVTINHPANAAKDLITPATGRLSQLDPKAMARQIENLLSVKLSPGIIRTSVVPYDWQVSTQALEAVYAL